MLIFNGRKKPSRPFTRALLLIVLIMPVAHVRGAAFQNDAHDMLTDAEFENENSDSVSRWGVSATQKHKEEVLVAKPLSPISENSFEKIPGNRAPASVAEVNTRAPAGVETAQLQASDEKANARAVVRAINKKKAYQEAAVIATDLGFFPSTVFVTQGIPVRLYVTGASNKSQCFMLDTYGVRRQVRSAKVEEITFTPDQSGTYAFTCPMNGAKGTVVVKELDLGRLPASVKILKAENDESSSGDFSHGDEKPAAKSQIKDSDFGPEFQQ